MKEQKNIERLFQEKFKYAIYIALLCNLALVISTAKNPGSLIFITSAIALVGLIIDILITVKGNLPINDIINSWSPQNKPANWTEYRSKWLELFQYRQIANITAYLSRNDFFVITFPVPSHALVKPTSPLTSRSLLFAQQTNIFAKRFLNESPHQTKKE